MLGLGQRLRSSEVRESQEVAVELDVVGGARLRLLGLANGLSLDDVDPARGDDDVVDVEAVGRQVMQDQAILCNQSVELHVRYSLCQQAVLGASAAGPVLGEMRMPQAKMPKASRRKSHVAPSNRI